LFSIVLGIFFDKTKSLVGVFLLHFMIGTSMFYFKY
jgi:membrane protease YdiL (CAAX protease family)